MKINDLPTHTLVATRYAKERKQEQKRFSRVKYEGAAVLLDPNLAGYSL